MNVVLTSSECSVALACSLCLEAKGTEVTVSLTKSNKTHFICFTMVLFPDSPAPTREGKTGCDTHELGLRLGE